MLHPRDWSLPTALLPLPLPPRRPAADAAKSLMSDWRSAMQTKAYEGLRVLHLLTQSRPQPAHADHAHIGFVISRQR